MTFGVHSSVCVHGNDVTYCTSVIKFVFLIVFGKLWSFMAHRKISGSSHNNNTCQKDKYIVVLSICSWDFLTIIKIQNIDSVIL